MKNNKLHDLLTNLRLHGIKAAVDTELAQAEKEGRPTTEVLLRLLTQEYAFRQQRSFDYRIGQAKIPWDWTLTTFPFDRQPGGKEDKVFDSLEWLAAMCCHVPNKGEQMVRYVGFYSNVSRGKRKKQNQDGVIPSILDPDGSSSEYRKNWARLPAPARLIESRRIGEDIGNQGCPYR